MWPSLGPEPRAVSRQPGRQPMSGVIVVPSPPNEVRLGDLKTLDSLNMEKNIKNQLHQKLKLRWDFNEEQSGAVTKITYFTLDKNPGSIFMYLK